MLSTIDIDDDDDVDGYCAGSYNDVNDDAILTSSSRLPGQNIHVCLFGHRYVH